MIYFNGSGRPWIILNKISELLTRDGLIFTTEVITNLPENSLPETTIWINTDMEKLEGASSGIPMVSRTNNLNRIL